MTHCCPTRRSADLHGTISLGDDAGLLRIRHRQEHDFRPVDRCRGGGTRVRHDILLAGYGTARPHRWANGVDHLCQSWFHPHWRRSEEHTSELQSLMRISYAVFCLKKKKDTP